MGILLIDGKNRSLNRFVNLVYNYVTPPLRTNRISGILDVLCQIRRRSSYFSYFRSIKIPFVFLISSKSNDFGNLTAGNIVLH